MQPPSSSPQRRLNLGHPELAQHGTCTGWTSPLRDPRDKRLARIMITRSGEGHFGSPVILRVN